MPTKRRIRKPYDRRKINEAEILWLDLFQDLMIALSSLSPEDLALNPRDHVSIARRARLLTDAALDEYSDRWARKQP